MAIYNSIGAFTQIICFLISKWKKTFVHGESLFPLNKLTYDFRDFCSHLALSLHCFFLINYNKIVYCSSSSQTGEFSMEEAFHRDITHYLDRHCRIAIL